MDSQEQAEASDADVEHDILELAREFCHGLTDSDNASVQVFFECLKDAGFHRAEGVVQLVHSLRMFRVTQPVQLETLLAALRAMGLHNADRVVELRQWLEKASLFDVDRMCGLLQQIDQHLPTGTWKERMAELKRITGLTVIREE